jgi:hypothetical protein
VTVSFSRRTLLHGINSLIRYNGGTRNLSYRLEFRGSIPGRGSAEISFLHDTASRPALGPIQPRIHWVPTALFQGVKRPGREADDSPPSSAEVKNIWI